MDLRSIRLMLQEQASNMPPASRKTIEWILTNTLKIAWMGIEEVAQKVGVSTATIVKTVKLCGFEGYSDLQRQIRNLIPDSFLVTSTFQSSDAHSSLITKVIESEKRNLEQLGDALHSVFPQFLQILLSAKTIHIVGSSMTTPIAKYLVVHLNLLLGNTTFINADKVQSWLALRNLDGDDCVIGVSFPRYSKFTQSFLVEASERTRHVAVITDYAGPDLPQAELCLRLPSYSRHYLSSHASLTAFLQILSRCLAEDSPERIVSNLEAAERIRALFPGG